MSDISDKRNNEEGDLTTNRTCLFTNKPLDKNTKIEHTIPRALCGRIRSKTVTCSEFNEASSKCDAVLREEFIMLLSALAPVLPKEFNPGKVPVTLDDNIPAIKKNGFIELQKPYVVKKTPKGIPQEVYLPLDPAKTERTIKKLGIKSKTQQIIPLPGDMSFITDIPICSNLAVISILKSVLCTIDAILQIEKKELFTRSKEMEPIIDFVRDSVSKEEDAINIKALDCYYLGIQLFDQEIFEKALSFHHYKSRPFEHVIIFSSNTAIKTLDAAWNIFSHEVHGIRLATKWTGPKVCGYIGNPILKEIHYHHDVCFDIENPFFKLEKSKIKGFSFGEPPQDGFFYYPVLLRQQAYYDVICYVETNNDQHLVESFRETSKFTDHTTLLDLLIARLKRTFKDSYKENLAQELEIINKKYEVWKDQSVSILFDDTNQLLPLFIHDYKEAFSSLVKVFYPPSKIIHRMSCDIKKVPIPSKEK